MTTKKNTEKKPIDVQYEYGKITPEQFDTIVSGIIAVNPHETYNVSRIIVKFEKISNKKTHYKGIITYDEYNIGHTDYRPKRAIKSIPRLKKLASNVGGKEHVKFGYLRTADELSKYLSSLRTARDGTLFGYFSCKTHPHVKERDSTNSIKPASTKKPKKYRQIKVPGTNKNIDRALPAKPVGWRTSDTTGKWYFERRENRSDTDKERKYYAGVNRRAKPNSGTGNTSNRGSRKLGTTRRVTPVGKLDKQKPHVSISVTPPPDNTKVKVPRGLTYYEPKLTTKLSAKQLEKIIVRECLKIHTKKTEYFLAIDKCGNVLCRGHGGVRSVPVPDSQFYEKYNHELVTVHNHPGKSWYGAPSPFSGQDLFIQRLYNIRDCRVVCRGYMYKCVIMDKTAFQKTTAASYRSIGDDHFEEAAYRAAAEITYPVQSTKDTSETYNKKIKKFHINLAFRTTSIVHARYREWLNTGHGLHYSRKIFTKEGLIKNE